MFVVGGISRRMLTKKVGKNGFLNGPIPASFSFIFWSFQTNITIFTTNICEKISIQYTVPGFEPTTFGM